MLIREPCPECGRRPYRPAHVEDHGVEVDSLDQLVEWGNRVSG